MTTEEQIQSLASEVAALRQLVNQMNGATGSRVFLAAMSDGDKDGKYETFTEQIYASDGKDFAFRDFIRTGEAVDSGGSLLILEQRSDKAIKYVSIPRGTVPVLVTKIDGSAGTASTACAFTYSYTDVDGNELVSSANKQQPQCNRPTKGAMLAGTHGLAYRGWDGAWILWWVDEQPDKAGCA